MKSWLAVIAAVISLQWGPTAVRAGTSDVFRADAFLQGVVQSGILSNPVISKVQVISADLINFALGHPLGTPINSQVALALASDCVNGELRLIVYDLNSGGNLATIGSVQPVLEVDGLKKKKLTRDIIGNLVILPTGDGTNGLTGGELKLSATISATTNICLTGLKGSMLGTLGTVFPYVLTNYPCTNFVTCSLTNAEFCVTNCVPDGTLDITHTVTNYTVAVSKATVHTKGKQIGQLIEEP